ncbi:BTB/POZ domain-containing protein [Phlyctema vagabunda]|uniref:BTB/POZ domain-containing protein n=1 Tax=Phlyctema vagabunda TaxID=108571 RepID=A0ABR4P2Q2_9HELO
MVHKSILCEQSEFFSVACKPEWMAAKDQVIKLPEDESLLITAMVYWMYHDRIYLSDDIIDVSCEFEDHVGTYHLSAMTYFCKLYILGEKYRIQRFKNDILDAIYHRWEGMESYFFPVDLVNYIYQNTTSPDCKLRKILIKIMSHDMDIDILRDEGHRFNSYALRDLALHYIGYDGSDNFSDYSKFCSEYHKHDSSDFLEPCEEPKMYDVESEQHD